MKLLWYTDTLNFIRYGKSMTGLVYKHIPYGTLPLLHNEILFLSTIRVGEEIIYETSIYIIIPSQDISIILFSLEELNILETIATKFKDFNTDQIVQYMHEEIA